MEWDRIIRTLGPYYINSVLNETTWYDSDPCSCSSFPVEPMLPYLTILRFASDAMNSHSVVLTSPMMSYFLFDLKTEYIYLSSRSDYWQFLICISACSFLPGWAFNIILLFRAHRKLKVRDRQVSSAIWPRNMI